MLGSITGFVTLAVAGRAVSAGYDTFEIMLYRSLIGMALVLAAAWHGGQLALLRPRRLRQHALRNLFHFAGQNFWLQALTLIPLAQLFAVEFSYPIMVALAAPLVLGERFTLRQFAAAVLGFGGVLLAAQPWAAGGLSLGVGIALLAAVGFAGSTLVTKQLTQAAPMVEILFWLTVFQFGFGLLLAAADAKIAAPTAAAAPWLLLIGISGLGAHYCLTRALMLAPASVVAPIDFLRLPVIGVVGALFYAEPLQAAVLAGGAVIFAASWLNLRGGRRPQGVETPQQDAA